MRYANTRGLIDINIPTAPQSIPRTYIQHAFTVEELQSFFHSCDSIKAKYGLIGKIQKITVPVFFRLLYSSGIRTTEARLLRREDVNLENGVVNIRLSKGYNQHFVVLHDTTLDLMKKYDVAISKIISGRTFFFPTRSNKGYPGSWVTRIFRICWYEGNKASAIAYELRHHYAVENINGWIEGGKRVFLNLYLDPLPAEQYLFVNLAITGDIVTTTFYLQNNGDIPNDIFEIIETHYNKLHLLERFSANINEVVTSLENTVNSFIGKLPLDEIKDSIFEKSNRDRIAFGHNYWKSILEIELANCVEYMNRFVTID